MAATGWLGPINAAIVNAFAGGQASSSDVANADTSVEAIAASPDQSVEVIDASPDPSVETITRGLKRSLTLSSGKDEHTKQIPRHQSWEPDSHLYSADGSGVRFNKINVEDIDEIFLPVGTKCFFHDYDKGKDYWQPVRPRWSGAPSRWHWKRWYGAFGSQYDRTDPGAGPSVPAADPTRFIETHDEPPAGWAAAEHEAGPAAPAA